MLDFSNNVNFFGPPVGYKKAIRAKDFLLYPDYSQKIIREKLAKKYGVELEQVFLSVGATEALSITAKLSEGMAAGFCPTFWEYEHFYTQHHGKDNYKKFFLSHADGFEVSLDRVNSFIKLNGIKTFYINNPNNPTTTLFDKTFLLDLISSNPEVMFIVDETYLIFSPDYDQSTLSKAARGFKNLVVITSLSKIYSLPSLRLGVVISNSEYISKFKQQVIPYGVSYASQRCLEWLLEQKNFLDKTRENYFNQSKNFKRQLEGAFRSSIKIYASSAPYFLIQLLTSNGSNKKFEKLPDFLKTRGVLVRSGSEFETLDEAWVRLSIKESRANRKLINLIGSFLKE